MLAMTNPLSIPPENHAISTKNPSIPPPSLRQILTGPKGAEKKKKMENRRWKEGNLVLTTELKTYIGHRRELKRPTFRALALRQSDRSDVRITCYTLPPTQHHGFLRKLPPLFVGKQTSEAQKSSKHFYFQILQLFTIC